MIQCKKIVYSYSFSLLSTPVLNSRDQNEKMITKFNYAPQTHLRKSVFLVKKVGEKLTEMH